MKKVLLENEITMVFQPKIAEIFGVTESIILQQMHYWLLKSKHIIKGTPWIYNSYEAWHSQINFLCKRTIIRAIKKLEDEGVVLSSNFNKSKMDKTKWYSINYEKLHSLCDAFVDDKNSESDIKLEVTEDPCDTSADTKDEPIKFISKYSSPSSIRSKSSMDNAYFNKAIPETTTEINLKKEEEKGELSEVVNFYEENISCASPYELEQLKGFMVDFDSKDLIILGIKQALKSNAKNLRYIEKVLYSWKHKGLNQKEQVVDFLNNYKKRKGGKKGGRPGGNYEQSWCYNSKAEKKEYRNLNAEVEKTVWYQGDMEGVI